MSRARVYARNLLANWIGLGANLLVMFFLSPFILHTLGLVEFGIWSLLNVVMGYMGILDIGVRASTGRYVMLYLGRDDHGSVDQTIRTALGFFSAIGVVIVVAGYCLGWVFPSAFSSVPDSYRGLIRLLLTCMAVNVWVLTMGAVFSSVLTAHDRFDLARGVDLSVLGIRTAGTVWVLSRGYGILGLALTVLLCNLLALVGNWILASKVYPRLRAWPLLLSRARLRELFSYGVFAFISKIAFKLIGQTDLLIVGAALSVSRAATYAVGAMLVYYSANLMNVIGRTFFPPVQRAVARGEMGSARWLLLRQVRLGLLIGTPVYVGFVLFAKPFILLWMSGPALNTSAAGEAATVMILLAVAKVLFLPCVGASEFLAAVGRVRFTAYLTLLEAVVNLGLSLLFVLGFQWGLAGVAAGTVVSRLIIKTFVLPWYTCRHAGIAWSGFLLRIFGHGLLAAAAFAGCCTAIRHLLPIDSWLDFWVSVGLALCAYVPLGFWLLLPGADRERIWRGVKGRFAQEA